MPEIVNIKQSREGIEVKTTYGSFLKDAIIAVLYQKELTKINSNDLVKVICSILDDLKNEVVKRNLTKEIMGKTLTGISAIAAGVYITALSSGVIVLEGTMAASLAGLTGSLVLGPVGMAIGALGIVSLGAFGAYNWYKSGNTSSMDTDKTRKLLEEYSKKSPGELLDDLINNYKITAQNYPKEINFEEFYHISASVVLIADAFYLYFDEKNISIEIKEEYLTVLQNTSNIVSSVYK